MKKDNPPGSADALRQKALQKLKKQTGRLHEFSSKDMQHLIAELGTHQIELEMQNEQLRIAQMELDASRRKYADLYDFAPVGYFTFDRRGVIREANLTGAGQLGEGRRELLKKPFSFFLADAESRKTFADHCDAVLRTGAGAACEIRLRRKDGALFSARLQSIVVENDGGKPEFVRSVVSDVTGLKEMEQRLHDSEERYRLMAETSSDVIFQLDAEGRIIYVSPAVNQYGYKPEGIVGSFFTAHIDPRDQARATDAFHRAASGSRIDMLELRLRYATGAPYYAEINVTSVIKRSNGAVIQGISRDISARKSLETALKQTNTDLETVNKELEAFSYTIANDLRAPLRTIEGFARAIIEDYRDRLDGTATDYFSRIRAAAHRMDQYIEAMWALSSVSRRELAENAVDLHEIVEAIAADLQRKQPERKVDFVIADGVKVKGDRELLRIALENLLDNAWKFTANRPAAKIEFGVIETDGNKNFFVRDNGAGFNMAYADQLFQPFRRLHTASEFPGIGIGLAIANNIIKRHGGRMWAEGEVEKGATFFFTW
jgi:PAS domain S-box-containing protein